LLSGRGVGGGVDAQSKPGLSYARHARLGGQHRLRLVPVPGGAGTNRRGELLAAIRRPSVLPCDPTRRAILLPSEEPAECDRRIRLLRAACSGCSLLIRMGRLRDEEWGARHRDDAAPDRTLPRSRLYARWWRSRSRLPDDLDPRVLPARAVDSPAGRLAAEHRPGEDLRPDPR
jgi:hypothetical protein